MDFFSDSYLESHVDGWGNDRIYYGYPNTGLVEMRAWCNMSVMFKHKVEFGPSVNNEQFEVNLPLGSWFPETIPLSVTVSDFAFRILTNYYRCNTFIRCYARQGPDMLDF